MAKLPFPTRRIPIPAAILVLVLALCAAPAAAQTRLYILTSGSTDERGIPSNRGSRVLEIDLDEARLVADTPVRHTRVGSVGPRVTPDGRFLVWAGSEQHRMPRIFSLFDTASRQQTTPLTGGSGLSDLPLLGHPSAMRMFFQHAVGAPVTVVEPGGLRTLPPLPCASPGLQAISGDGARLFLGCGSSASVVVDSGDGRLLGTVPNSTGKQASNDAGTELYTVNWGWDIPNEPVYRRFDVASGALLAERTALEDSFQPSVWQLNPHTGHLYVGSLDGSVQVLDSATLAPVAVISAPGLFGRPLVALDPDRPAAYIVWSGTIVGGEWSAIAQVDTHTFETIAAADLSIDSHVVGIALGPRPPRALNLTAHVEGSTVTLQWTNEASRSMATRLIVEAGTAPGLTDIARLSVGVGATSLTVPNVPRGTYHVRVRSANGTGLSEPSNSATVVVP